MFGFIFDSYLRDLPCKYGALRVYVNMSCFHERNSPLTWNLEYDGFLSS